MSRRGGFHHSGRKQKILHMFTEQHQQFTKGGIA
jgi:hypothetical protein